MWVGLPPAYPWFACLYDACAMPHTGPALRRTPFTCDYALSIGLHVYILTLYCMLLGETHSTHFIRGPWSLPRVCSRIALVLFMPASMHFSWGPTRDVFHEFACISRRVLHAHFHTVFMHLFVGLFVHMFVGVFTHLFIGLLVHLFMGLSMHLFVGFFHALFMLVFTCILILLGSTCGSYSSTSLWSTCLCRFVHAPLHTTRSHV